jgi:hypothetical protein
MPRFETWQSQMHDPEWTIHPPISDLIPLARVALFCDVAFACSALPHSYLRGAERSLRHPAVGNRMSNVKREKQVSLGFGVAFT